MAPPSKQRPGALAGADRAGIEPLAGRIEGPHDSPPLGVIQQVFVLRRFPSLTPPVARCVAELHFGRA